MSLFKAYYSVIVISILAAVLGVPSHTHAAIELSTHHRGFSPDAGGVEVLGARARWNWVEVSVQSFAEEPLAYSLAAVKPFVQHGSFLASIGGIVLQRQSTRSYGSTLGFRWNPLTLGSTSIGFRLDNEILYVPNSQRLHPEYLIGLTLNWR